MKSKERSIRSTCPGVFRTKSQLVEINKKLDTIIKKKKSTMETKFESWAVIELFGHAKIAGLCSEQNIAGTNMLRVDVPETESNPKFTRFLGGSSIYAINPVTEEIAIHVAKNLNVKPIDNWDIREFQKKQLAQLKEANSTDYDENQDNDYF